MATTSPGEKTCGIDVHVSEAPVPEDFSLSAVGGFLGGKPVELTGEMISYGWRWKSTGDKWRHFDGACVASTPTRLSLKTKNTSWHATLSHSGYLNKPIYGSLLLRVEGNKLYLYLSENKGRTKYNGGSMKNVWAYEPQTVIDETVLLQSKE